MTDGVVSLSDLTSGRRPHYVAAYGGQVGIRKLSKAAQRLAREMGKVDDSGTVRDPDAMHRAMILYCVVDPPIDADIVEGMSEDSVEFDRLLLEVLRYNGLLDGQKEMGERFFRSDGEPDKPAPCGGEAPAVPPGQGSGPDGGSA